jgi:predicted HAD superfamily hydrolase
MAQKREAKTLNNSGAETHTMIETTSDSLIRQVDQAKLVSFDVFDTLIHRAVHQPTDVFEVLAAQLRNHAVGLFNPGAAVNFAHYRVLAEREARSALLERAHTPEVSLEQIYQTLSEVHDLSESHVATISELETELERLLAYANPLMLEVFNYARAKGKLIVLCSDMYLPVAVIQNILNRCGYTPPFELLVSHDLRLSKHEGSLWPELLARFRVAPQDVVHFGDNLQADVQMPRAAGISAFHFDYLPRHVDPRLRMKGLPAEEDRHVWSLIQGTIREKVMNCAQGFWEDIGLQVFGPLLLGNFIWSSVLAKQDRVEKLLFFARDAHLPYQIFQKYHRDFGLNIDAEYAYFSRAALLLPSFVDMPIDRVYHLFSGRSPRTVSQHFKRLGINPHLFLHMISEVGFSGLDDVVSNGDSRMHRLLNILWPQILLEAKRRRPLPARYAAQLAGKANRLGIVDIGWTGNMQGGFSRLLQLSRLDFEIRGYYYGTFDLIHLNYLPRNLYRGYLVNENTPDAWYTRLTSGGVELLEFALMAPHGTTLGYREENGTVHPILEENPADIEAQALAAQVQKGAMAFIDAAMPRVLEIGPASLVSRAWAFPFSRLIDEPSLEEATLLGDLTHSDSAADTRLRLPVAEAVPTHRRRMPDFALARERAYWKRAFDVRNSELSP